MSKPNSGYFRGTIGDKLSKYSIVANSIDTKSTESDIISSRVRGLDLREHPLKYKQLSKKKLKVLRQKLEARTITKAEYKTLVSNQRLSLRRQKGVLDFWNQEKHRIQMGQQTSRNWTYQQMYDIVHDRKPKHQGKPLHAHHTYSVSRYPHLADQGAVLFPVTFYEHLYGWHGGNFKRSQPGKPVNPDFLQRKHSSASGKLHIKEEKR